MTRKFVAGWLFRNESDCFGFLHNSGLIASYQAIVDEGVEDVGEEGGGESPCCPPVWDGFLCWPPAPRDSQVSQPCPANIPQLNINNFAFRNCSGGGGWLLENGSVDTGPSLSSSQPLGYTNFQPCFDKDVIDVVRGFFNGSDAEIEKKMFILTATRVLEVVGYTLSLLSIALSLFILSHFSFENPRKKNSLPSLPGDVDPVSNISLSSSSISCYYSNDSSYHEEPTVTESPHQSYAGIGNVIAVCQLSWILLEYSRTAMFHWMFIEGLHLHNILVVNVFLNNSTSNHRIYLMVGWLGPLVTTTLWATMAFLYMDHRCWFGYNHKAFYWISEGPRLVIILGNSVFLFNIIRMLYVKAGNQQNSVDPSATQIRLAELGSHAFPFDPVERGLRTSVKAAVVLQPLLGITNILQIVFNPYNADVSYFTFWSITTAFLASFQGFFAALFYCFCNREIHHSFLVQMNRRQTQNLLPARSESTRTARIRLSFRRSNLSSKQRPSWCQEVPSSGASQSCSAEEGTGWSPRGRSIDLRACGPIRVLSSVEEGVEVQALSL